MSLAERLTIPPDAMRFPARHVVVCGVLTQDGDEIPVVVKKARRSYRDRFAPSMAERSYATAVALRARGIPTPEPLGAEDIGEESWFVARRIEGAEQIRTWFLRRDDPSRPAPTQDVPFAAIVTELGRIARAMHDSGVHFRDFTDGNILVSAQGTGFRLWLVDLSRARLSSRPVGFWSRWRDLARPGLNRPEDLKLLLSSYFGLPDPPPRALLGVRLLRARIVFWDELKQRLRPWRRERS
ncbi:MAG: lipopolysaccharide kinase InaA family protein [Thermoanaerobaculia bacterium]